MTSRIRRIVALAAVGLLALAAAPTALADPASPDPEAAQREHWQARKADLERAVAEARVRLATAEAEYSRGRRASRARGDERASRKIELDEARKELERAESELAEFPEEARRAGVPPGWIR